MEKEYAERNGDYSEAPGPEEIDNDSRISTPFPNQPEESDNNVRIDDQVTLKKLFKIYTFLARNGN